MSSFLAASKCPPGAERRSGWSAASGRCFFCLSVFLLVHKKNICLFLFGGKNSVDVCFIAWPRQKKMFGFCWFFGVISLWWSRERQNPQAKLRHKEYEDLDAQKKSKTRL